MAVVLDSSAVIGFLDRDDALHLPADEAIRRWAAEQSLLASAITYAEVLTGARSGHHGESTVQSFFTDLISSVLPVDMPIADKAADLRSSTPSLRMPDALIVATALVHDNADLLLTGDTRIGKLPALDVEVQLIR